MSTITLNGREVSIQAGETILAAAARQGIEVPTLCNDDRLTPVGACRMCLVEVKGQRRLVPSCMTPAAPGMEVVTESERIDRHRKSLIALYLTDHPEEDGCETGAPCQLHRMAERYQAPRNWASLESRRGGSYDPENPFIRFRPDRCIACSQCVRYCEEVEGVSAIAMVNRGAATTVSTAAETPLMESTCEMCGGCIAVCPTGAMTEHVPLRAGDRPERELTKVRTTCNYCGVGCQMDLNVDPEKNKVVKVTSPPAGTLPNDGNLCVKGRFAYQFVHHPERLQTPLVRGEDGELHPATWDDALKRAADGMMGVRSRHGADSLGFISSSRCTMEENYLVQKLARAVFGTNNVHQCAAT